jgi:hypothetical protein
MSRSKRQQRRAYLRGEPSPSMNLTVVVAVFSMLIIGVLVGVILVQSTGGALFGARPQVAGSIQQNQAQAGATATAFNSELASIPRVDLATAKSLYDSKQVTMVDARNTSEFEQGHIAGAISLPLVDLQQKVSLLPEDHSAQIIAYCA